MVVFTCLTICRHISSYIYASVEKHCIPKSNERLDVTQYIVRKNNSIAETIRINGILPGGRRVLSYRSKFSQVPHNCCRCVNDKSLRRCFQKNTYVQIALPVRSRNTAPRNFFSYKIHFLMVLLNTHWYCVINVKAGRTIRQKAPPFCYSIESVSAGNTNMLVVEMSPSSSFQ